MSRFKIADDILILQPFELKTFQQGVPQQPTLLLRYIALQNKDDIHEDLQETQMNFVNQQAAKRQRTHENRAASADKNRQKRTRDDMAIVLDTNRQKRTRDGMALVLETNKKHMTVEAKERRKRVPKMQVQCCACGQVKYCKDFTQRQWDKKGTCKACKACKPKLR